MKYLNQIIVLLVMCLFIILGCQDKKPGENSGEPKNNNGDSAMVESKTNPVTIQLSLVDFNPENKQSIKLKVVMVNSSDAKLLVNKRMAPGYWDSDARELIVDIFTHGTDEQAARPANLYERNMATENDFVWLEKNESVESVVDIREWYDFPMSGNFDIQVTYKTDDVDNKVPNSIPENSLKGQFTSDKITIEL